MIDDLKPLIGKLTVFAKDRMGFSRPPKLFLKQDSVNSQKMLGRTAHYDPQNQAVTLYVSGRHPKDILRSYAHELVHHLQNLRGDLKPERMGDMGDNYAQDNDHMRNMEKEAYLQGNMCFRDFEDSLDNKDKKIYKLAESKFIKENKTMTTKITKGFLKEMIEKILETELAKPSKLPPKKRTGVSSGERGEVEVKPIKKENEENDSDVVEEENEEIEEGGNAKTDKHDDNPKLKGGQKNLPDSLQKGIISSADSDSDSEEKKDESKIQTPEEENTLYEQRFTPKNNRLYEKLVKQWTK